MKMIPATLLSLALSPPAPIWRVLHILTMVKKVTGPTKRIFSLADLAMLCELLERLPNPQFVGIDPLGSYNAAAATKFARH